MSSDQLPLPAAPLHRNQQLFSDHYLDVLLPQRGDWRLLAAEVGTIRSRVAAIVAGFTPSKNEAQTEHELVRPILAALGHTFEAQAPLATPLGTKKPDYVFYRDVAALNANKKFDAWLAHADDLARRQRFFHWELEFPEVFFDRHGQPLGECAGFDAVIGNPPYVRQEALAPLKPFLAADFAEMYQGTADLFVYFFAQGCANSGKAAGCRTSPAIAGCAPTTPARCGPICAVRRPSKRWWMWATIASSPMRRTSIRPSLWCAKRRRPPTTPPELRSSRAGKV